MHIQPLRFEIQINGIWTGSWTEFWTFGQHLRYIHQAGECCHKSSNALFVRL